MNACACKKFVTRLSIITIALVFVTLPQYALAANYATFESFYKEGLSLGSWIIGGVLAVVGVAAVFFTAGAAAPFTASIGSAIGGMMGLSGAAATSAGLALLGGGSLAAGGFGMLGGTVLLTAIFEGSVLGGTQIARSILNSRNYSELCEQVKDYPNFPPIQNGSGPKVIAIVKNELEDKYDMKQLPSSPDNISAVNNAILEINNWTPSKEKFYSIGHETKVRREKLRVYSLRAILEFMGNNYEDAYSWADMAWEEHKTSDGPCTVPNFIKAVAGVFIGKVDIHYSSITFNSVIHDENKNPILPLLFSIYISRVGALNKVDVSFLNGIILASYKIKDKETRSVVTSQVMTAILAKLWENQETINFYLQNNDQLDAIKVASESKKLGTEYEQVLNLAHKYILKLDIDSDAGKDFYNKSYTALEKYIKSLPTLQEAVVTLQK